MAIYKFQSAVREDGVKKDSMSIPASSGNRHWKEFLEWEALGNVADPHKNEVELVEEAKGLKTDEITRAYLSSNETRTVVIGGDTYDASEDTINTLYVEANLAHDNSETEILIFDTDLDPHDVPLSAVASGLQTMRAAAKADRAKGKSLVKQVRQAATVEEVEAISW